MASTDHVRQRPRRGCGRLFAWPRFSFVCSSILTEPLWSSARKRVCIGFSGTLGMRHGRAGVFFCGKATHRCSVNIPLESTHVCCGRPVRRSSIVQAVNSQPGRRTLAIGGRASSTCPQLCAHKGASSGVDVLGPPTLEGKCFF